MTDCEALLAAVCHAPDDDTPITFKMPEPARFDNFDEAAGIDWSAVHNFTSREIQITSRDIADAIAARPDLFAGGR